VTDVMLDIETLGTKPGCVVLTVGAVAFDFETGEELASFYKPISITNSQSLGLGIDASTLGWWLEQDQAAITAAMKAPDKVPLKTAAAEFHEWFSTNCNGNIWAQGMDFDMPIWGFAMEAADVERPWKFWTCRDTRTAYQVCNFDTATVEREGTYHNALDDARHQVRCLQAAKSSR